MGADSGAAEAGVTGTSGTARATACQREYTDADIAAALTRGGAKSPLCCSIQRAPTALRDGWPAMGKEKKRKRPVDVGGQAAQETASPDACDVGRDGGFTVQLTEGRSVCITGACDVAVTDGELLALGFRAGAGANVLVTADPKGSHVEVTAAPGRGPARLRVSPRDRSGRAWLPTAAQAVGVVVPPSWQTIAKEVCGAGAGEPPPRVCIVGAKSTGKSTMSRLIANALLARAGAVVYLDTDMGQGEFSPPGTVAATLVSGPVFGPPWMQQAARPDLKPWVVRYLGDTSPQGDPVGYLRAVQALLADAAAAFPNAPVVVNTHGWTRGTGLDLLLEILDLAGPSHVVVMQQTGASKQLTPEDVAGVIDGRAMPPAVLTAPSAVVSSSSGARAEKDRDKSTAALLCRATGLDLLAMADDDLWRSLATAIETTPPLEAAIGALRVRSCATGAVVSPAALPGQIVGLAATNGRCLGCAFVRSVDPARGMVQLLTDVDPDAMEQVDELLVGSLGVVYQILRSDRASSGFLAQHCVSSAGVGAKQQRSRSGIQRARLA